MPSEEFDKYWSGNVMLTPEEQDRYYRSGETFIRSYMEQKFDIAEYIRVVRESYESILNMIQFFIRITVLRTDIDHDTKLRCIACATQVIFWMGYNEGLHANDPEPELPKGFFDALGE